MASVTWDKARLESEIRSLRGLESGAFVPRLAQLIAAGGVKLTMDTFRSQRNPYGEPWAPLKRERTRDKRARLRREAKGLKSRGQKILLRTKVMRNSTAAIASGHAGGVGIPVGYAAAHQYGTHVIPQRQILPSAEKGLPGTWVHMIGRETIGLLTRWANKGSRL